MKLTLTVLMFCLAGAAASTYSQNTRLDVKIENGNMIELIKQIEAKSEFMFYYQKQELSELDNLTLEAHNATVMEILDKATKGTEFAYTVIDRYIVVRKVGDDFGNDFLATAEENAAAQQRSVSGKVTDSSGQPLPGATVVVKGTTQGTVTNADGNYSLTNIPEDATLVFSFVGMRTEEVVVGSQTSINVTMEEETIGLEEVVAVGYGSMKRSSVTGSISRVDSEQMEGFPSVNVMDAMQGQAAGVYISPSRQPGESPSIRIRGSRSLSASNNPLVIVDGMPGSWDNLVSQDIESMEILKDAAATAIYGSRASNGVILVTTKSAAKGISKLNVEIGTYVGINNYNFIKMQSAEKYAELIRDVMRYQTHGVMDTELWENSPIDTKRGMEMFHSTWATNYYDKGINFDWQKALFDNNSFTQGHNISLSNRTEKLAYRVAYNFQENNSYYKTVNYKRHVLNANADLKLTPWLNIGTISRLSLRQHSGWPDNMWDNMRRMTPFETPYIDEDSNNGFKDAVGKEMYVNALWNYEDGYLLDDRNGQMADIIFKAELKPFEWMTFTTNLQFDYHERQRGIYRDSKTSYQNLGLNYASMEKSSDFNTTWNGILNIEQTFKDNHKVLATAAIETIEEYRESVGASSQDIPARYMGYHFLQAGIINRDIWSEFRKSTLLSYLFRGQYEYMGKYLVNFALRADGSSRLSPDNRWRIFPSFSGAWVLSEESFMEQQNLFSSLKLRLSYGEVGNQAISPYQTMTTLSQKTYNWGNDGIFTWQPSGIANTRLGWEVSKTWNTGFDFVLEDNKISGGLEFYHTTNEDLLMQRRLPEATGFSNIWQNIGETVNKGIELSINSNIVSQKDLRWSLSGMFSRNWNEITALTGGKDDRGNQWFIGKPIEVVWDYKKEGIWQIDEAEEAQKHNMQPGEIKVTDRNGDYAFSDEDKFILGQREPKFIGSIQNSLNYKKIDFTFNVVGQFGHLITASNYTAEWNADKYIIDAIDWWTPLNPTNEWPRAHTAQSHKFSSTLNIFKGDFVKLQNISLGYDLVDSFLDPGINKLRIYIQASNPFYFYKACSPDINPEQPNTMYTIPATYVLGLNLNF